MEVEEREARTRHIHALTSDAALARAMAAQEATDHGERVGVASL